MIKYFIRGILNKGVFMIQTIKWTATIRENMTDGELNAKRKSGFVPAIISTRGKESTAVFLLASDLKKRPYGNFRIELTVEGIKEPFDCFLKDLQYNHTSDTIIHADLQGLTVGQELDIDILIELVGNPEGVKAGGVLNTSIHSVRIRTLPKNMPEKIVVDISKMKIGDSIHISDIKFSDLHTLLEPTEGTIVSIAEPRKAEDETSEEEATEPEIITEKAE